MSNYTKLTAYDTKDGLTTGDPLKRVKGTELDDEFDAISTAIATKANSASPEFTGTPTVPTAAFGVNTTQAASTAFVQAALVALYPVGSVYINATNATNPGTLLGFGTWSAFAAGRVLVGLNAGNALFDTAEETGGSADAITVSHTHTFSATTNSVNLNHTHQMGARDSTANEGGNVNFEFVKPYPSDVNPTSSGPSIDLNHSHTVSGTTASAGSSGTNANYQPYITVYMWKRTA